MAEPKDQIARRVANSGNVVPFDRAGRRRMVMVPEEEWREVQQVVKEWKRLRVGCPVARRILEVE